MKASTYALYFLKDFMIVLVTLVAGVALLMMLFTDKGLSGSLGLQLMMGALGINFIWYGLVQKHAVTKNQELASFFVYTSLAVILLMVWLYFFSVNGVFSAGGTAIFILSYLLMKISVFYMMRKDAREQAQALNQKLDRLNKGTKISE